MRDHRSLKVYGLAHRFVIAVYRETRIWPPDERFGLTAQVRRASISISSNIVEGCARSSQNEFRRFIEIAFASAKEASYQLLLAKELEMPVSPEIESLAEECCRALYSFHRSLE